MIIKLLKRLLKYLINLKKGEGEHMPNTLVFDGFITKIKNKNMTAKQIKSLKRAIVDIGTHTTKWLILAGRAVSFDLNGAKMYMYRLNQKERIIFGIENGNKKIYDIVDTDDLKR